MNTFLYIVCFFYAASSIVLLIYGLQCYILSYLFIRKRSKNVARQRKIMGFFYTKKQTQYPKVLTQLPMYNEKNVAHRIIEAAVNLEYPKECHEIQVLDDSTDDTIEVIDSIVQMYRKQGFNISVIRRANRTGFKAGALQNGLQQTDAEFVAIFDADFVPNPDFLKKAVPFFLNDEKVAIVQGRWTHLNRDASLLTKCQAVGIDGHFMVEQAARSWNNLFMNFNGTAGMFRISAIHDGGGWEHDTLTEDMDLSYRIQIKGWKTEFVPELEVSAEIPEDINAFKNQQYRWAKGSIQTAKKIFPRLLKEKVGTFKLLQAFFHLTHYSVHPLMLTMAYLSMPVLAFVEFDIPPIIFIGILSAMILATGGPSTMYLVAQHYIDKRKRRAFYLTPAMMITGIGIAVNNGRAVLEAVLGKESPFVRTPKKGDSQVKSVKHYKPIKDITALLEIFTGVYCLFSLYNFFGYSNFLVTPFLAIYATAFLFTGIMSLLHFHVPSLIDKRLRSKK